ncbi:MAG: alpha/beta hydrolase [Jatrophihabitans sp.]|uniref:alpha/beta hydrolase n=1 Tax=Jatrophihabitans sp. TaxID=1932789 RepID=UPI0039156B40
MEPDSTVLVVLLLLLAGGSIAAAIRYRPLAVKIAAGVLAVVLSAVSGILVVNIYYGYYQTWSQLSADLSGSYSKFAPANAPVPVAVRSTTKGRLESIALAGSASGISRTGLVYLPPQYFEPRYAHTRFPVVELLHGSPGNPGNWEVQLHTAEIMDKLMSERVLGPMVLVMPAFDAGNKFEECVDARDALDDTYISHDVPKDVRTRFRVSAVPAEWGIAGFSSGGYCAANLALRHRRSFGATGVIDGYFRPTDGPAAAALHFQAQAEADNNPLLLAGRLRPGVGPVPAVWVLAGTGGSKYDKGARAFIAAVRTAERVSFVREPGSGHNFYRWRPAVPKLLAWMWGQLAPPDLRVQFPVAGPVNDSTVVSGRAP